MPEVHARTLKRAAEIAGGEQLLALRLRVTPSHLALWLAGIEAPPVDIFLRAVDIVTEHYLSATLRSKKISADAPSEDQLC